MQLDFYVCKDCKITMFKVTQDDGSTLMCDKCKSRNLLRLPISPQENKNMIKNATKADFIQRCLRTYFNLYDKKSINDNKESANDLTGFETEVLKFLPEYLRDEPPKPLLFKKIKRCFISLIMIIGAILFVVCYLIPNAKYKKAIALYEKYSYESSKELFKEIESFKDSSYYIDTITSLQKPEEPKEELPYKIWQGANGKYTYRCNKKCDETCKYCEKTCYKGRDHSLGCTHEYSASSPIGWIGCPCCGDVDNQYWWDWYESKL